MAEGGGLLNRCTVKSRTGGSNPPLSAILALPSKRATIPKFSAKVQRLIGRFENLLQQTQILLFGMEVSLNFHRGRQN